MHTVFVALENFCLLILVEKVVQVEENLKQKRLIKVPYCGALFVQKSFERLDFEKWQNSNLK